MKSGEIAMTSTQIIASFEEIVGWPYPPKKQNGGYSKGATDDRGKDPAYGIDCSGAFVRAYKKHGLSIYHGSNTIFRKHCKETGKIVSVTSLEKGMAVFKQRLDGDEPSQYNGDGNGNMYHIGLVASVSPLRIIHATTPVAKVDTSLGSWGYYGYLSQVDYGQKGGDPVLAEQQATIVSENGEAVNLRPVPSTDKPYIAKMPIGSTVTVHEKTSEWATVTYNGKRGYCMAKFLSFTGTVDPPAPVHDDLETRMSFLENAVSALNEQVQELVNQLTDSDAQG